MQVKNARSTTYPLEIGVPQGSCLSPLLFVLYTTPLGAIFRKHGLKYHQYADDTQVYCDLSPRSPALLNTGVVKVEKCLEEVKLWMAQNKLKLNESKTECIIFSTKQNHHQFGNIKITFGGSVINPSSSVRDLGAQVDPEMNMDRQVNNIIRTSYFHLRRIAKIRRHLDQSSCAKAVIAFVTSRVDYHNGLLAGISCKNLDRLQRVQNNAARLVSQSPRHCHITPVLSDLHWLPIRARIDFKILMNVHKAVHSANAPAYLKDLCSPYTPTRTLRSSSVPHLLSVSRTKRKIGDRAFKTYACNIWNKLPQSLRDFDDVLSFKNHLKTHFFIIYF